MSGTTEAPRDGTKSVGGPTSAGVPSTHATSSTGTDGIPAERAGGTFSMAPASTTDHRGPACDKTHVGAKQEGYNKREHYSIKYQYIQVLKCSTDQMLNNRKNDYYFKLQVTSFKFHLKSGRGVGHSSITLLVTVSATTRSVTRAGHSGAHS